MSIYTLKYYQWNNRLPGYDRAGAPAQNIDPDKAAFSMAPHDEEAYAPISGNDHDDHHADHDTSYGGSGVGSTNPYGGASGSQAADPFGTMHSTHSQGSYGNAPENPFRQDNPFDNESDYHGGTHYGSQVGSSYAAPTAHDDYDAHAPAQFPTANYDRTVR